MSRMYLPSFSRPQSVQVISGPARHGRLVKVRGKPDTYTWRTDSRTTRRSRPHPSRDRELATQLVVLAALALTVLVLR